MANIDDNLETTFRRSIKKNKRDRVLTSDCSVLINLIGSLHTLIENTGGKVNPALKKMTSNAPHDNIVEEEGSGMKETIEGFQSQEFELNDLLVEDPSKLTVEMAQVMRESISEHRDYDSEVIQGEAQDLEVPAVDMRDEDLSLLDDVIEPYEHMWQMYTHVLTLIEREEIKNAWDTIYNFYPEESPLTRFNTLMLVKLQDHVHREKRLVEQVDRKLDSLSTKVTVDTDNIIKEIKKIQIKTTSTPIPAIAVSSPSTSKNINLPKAGTGTPTISGDDFLNKLKELRKNKTAPVKRDVVIIPKETLKFNPIILGPEVQSKPVVRFTKDVSRVSAAVIMEEKSKTDKYWDKLISSGFLLDREKVDALYNSLKLNKELFNGLLDPNNLDRSHHQGMIDYIWKELGDVGKQSDFIDLMNHMKKTTYFVAIIRYWNLLE
ncbi:ORF2 [Sanxia water strider virus 4]|uniref:ORF2 n=1 Tax=Sanxia water strider virus 4 TaxID=1608063 RepID=A0A0B5KXD7_9MONO|nr:ORF2 [Sanxia water strider virus 4]AJG39113.1 ORF2 [Sanxia water strider virus 4]